MAGTPLPSGPCRNALRDQRTAATSVRRVPRRPVEGVATAGWRRTTRGRCSSLDNAAEVTTGESDKAGFQWWSCPRRIPPGPFGTRRLLVAAFIQPRSALWHSPSSEGKKVPAWNGANLRHGPAQPMCGVRWQPSLRGRHRFVRGARVDSLGNNHGCQRMIAAPAAKLLRGQ